jgi:hypothetical protein
MFFCRSFRLRADAAVSRQRGPRVVVLRGRRWRLSTAGCDGVADAVVAVAGGWQLPRAPSQGPRARERRGQDGGPRQQGRQVAHRCVRGARRDFLRVCARPSARARHARPPPAVARAGGAVSPTFEGGQTPLHRRAPKRGYMPAALHRPFAPLNLDVLSGALASGALPAGAKIDVRALAAARRVSGPAARGPGPSLRRAAAAS